MTIPQIAFSLAIPPSWSELDLRPATRDRSIALMVQDRLSATPELRARRADMVAYLRNTARNAWDVGCRYCGAFVELASDGIVPGSVTVTLLPPAPRRGPHPLDDIIEQLSDTGDQGAKTWRRLVTVDLPHAGPAARTYGVQAVALSRNTAPVPAALMSTFVPFDGGVALVSAGSPAVDVADQLFELFAAVTDSFRLHPVDGTA